MQNIIDKLFAAQILTYQESKQIFHAIISGRLESVQVAAILIAMKLRHEQAEEIAGAAVACLEQAKYFPRPNYIFADISGTGGDHSNSINISTASAFVAAAGGFKIAKHGNCSISSNCGSSDLLANFHINLNMSAEKSRKALDDLNICFLFAPQYHQGFHYCSQLRKTLRTRTLFNILGPLINPARPSIAMIGVYCPKLALPMAQTLKLLGYKRALVVYGGGMDEVAIHTKTYVTELNGDQITNYFISPKDFGMNFYSQANVIGGTAKENFVILTNLLQGKGHKAHEAIVAINVAMLMKIFGHDNLYHNTRKALEIITSGQAYECLISLAARG